MSIICEDIPNTEETKKALYSDVSSLVRVRYVCENKIPGIDATKLAPCTMPVTYKKFASNISTMKVYKDDVFVTAFPKSGTTWTQEMVWLVANDLNYDSAKKSPIGERYGTIELSAVLRAFEFIDGKHSLEICEELPRPRFIKSHLPIALLPIELWTVKPKLVYVARNSKDAAISYYRQFSNLHGYIGSLEDFLDAFLNNLIPWTPHIDHVLGYWQLRNEPNILFITYEDMVKDLLSVLRKVAKFFEKTYTDDQYKELAKHLSFDEMKTNAMVNYDDTLDMLGKMYGGTRKDPNHRFMRRGKVNSSKDEMPIEYQEKFDKWMAEALEGSDFKFNN